ncbi:hypothetical protein PR202_ga31005 [Eleusine coracana subsp. coracana]|uniref:Uncharacterized protein n=1 Tax=Eleusine coracana subsp. coracana TaxID=191504 RepID=A0AAV5DS10_ELECO|nr:hypothetical protein QOZ80_3AG0229460 [Eleusine coracana subsp. coracana]GJN12700.1 hypothetical protein PR202_ga31005 [Eleusine coracana subsp. coracana]
MDFPELAKLAFSRVQKVEPENVGKILGCILLREPDEEEMVQLAYGTDADLLAKIADAKATLAAIYARCSAQQQHHHQIGAQRGAAAAGYGRVRHFSPAAAAFGFHVQSSYWPVDSEPLPVKVQQDCLSPHALLDVEGHYALLDQNGLDDHGYYYSTAEDALHNGGDPTRASSRRPSGLSTRRPCHYFLKGNCKNGQNCHYSHHHQVYYDGLGDEHHHHNNGTTPGALETLESEITELLKSRRGQPVSIASLPTLYGEKYGKGLQADGYLTESQRHGKAGYSLTKLLSRLNKIRAIERPHGQHSVVLAEDAARYTESRAERGGDMGSVPASSHQIYLTFPAESIFTEEDVANYFGQYGLVRDVRIPCQERRMFGFVSFQNPETVGTILMRRNPHFICGSRVLVKPYREKSKCVERMHVDKIKPMVHYYPTRFLDVDPEFHPGEYDTSSRLMRKQQITEKRERLIELERKRLAGIRLESLPQQFAYFDCSIEDVHTLNSLPAGSKDINLMDHPILVPDQGIVSTSQAPQTQESTNYDDKKSNDQIELLPESPFESAAPAGLRISGVI